MIGATNFPELLDKALVRPGRFDKHVVVPVPDVQGRFDILELHMKGIPRAAGVDLKIIARATPGLSGMLGWWGSGSVRCSCVRIVYVEFA